MNKVPAKYTNMTKVLTAPEKYSSVTLQQVMKFDVLYVTQLIDQGIFKPSPRAKQELQFWIDHEMAEELLIDDPSMYESPNT